MAVSAFRLLEQDLYFVADADLELGLPGGELVNRHQPLGLVADVDDDIVGCDRDYRASDNLALVEVPHAVVVHLDELFIGKAVLRFRQKRVGRGFFSGFHGFPGSRRRFENGSGRRFHVLRTATNRPRTDRHWQSAGDEPAPGSDGQV